jgi:hypothetical protein
MHNNLLNIENLHKLSTKEDPAYIHKILGGICMTNFLYQYYHIFIYGKFNLDNPLGLYLVSLHGILSISSLIFHIPSIRNRSAPMIYPEFRLHSIVFGLRAVFCFYLSYFKLHFIYKIAICYLTMIFADITTYYYNNTANTANTTNTANTANTANTTMRNMPFNENIPLKLQKKITHFNSSMQIAATLYMLGNTNSAFFTLYPIQLAAFMMTLIRKNIITNIIWHRIYSFLLISNIFCYFSLPISFIFIKILLFYLFIQLRFKLQMNKYYAWSIVFLIYTYINNIVINLPIEDIYIKKAIIIYFIINNYKNIL